MDIRPIVTPEDHRRALTLIEKLWGADAHSRDGRVLDILATLVDAYEREHLPLDAADPVDILKTHMEMTGRNQKDLAALLGSPSRASEILNRRRALTIEMAYKLHRDWGIPAEALITPYELTRA
ncbi:MAG TPA: helix-turn-helix domain-containing protein [Mesorhizobium sp.]|jgi:HTH-type transcriptional regulator/antitoxin HigA|nr:helix-turn-helix domain-containing protein [Mesorhizobium sp.]